MTAKKTNWKLRRWLGAVAVVLGTVAALFIYNGTNTAWKKPSVGFTPTPPETKRLRELRVLTWNIAKCNAYDSRMRFRPPADVRTHLDQIAALIRAEQPDLIALTEINLECGPCPVNQVEHLARALEMPAWAFGENSSFGVPFFRIRSGNALLSRLPLRALEVEQLAGGMPFYNPRNNRRILWCEISLNERPLLVASLRNDSFNPENNLRQVEQILRKIDGRPAILAGDFNVRPDQPAMKRWKDSGLFVGDWAGPPTFPAESPNRRIDEILAPVEWKLVSSKTIQSDLSDHLPVISVFEVREVTR